jgi:HAE1 family hydrophobic/amphiphilic exporter-1
MGLNIEEVSSMLETVLSGSQSGTFKEAGKEFPIIVGVENTESMSLDEILNLTVNNNKLVPVMLKSVVSTEKSESATQIERVNQERMIDVSANLSGRSLSSVISDIQKELNKMTVPEGFSLEIAGDYKEQQKAFKELLIGFILAIILIFAVMAAQYESFKDPFIVMFSVPLAVIGVVLLLFLTGTTFNIQSYIGCIMLGGIVVNNAILLVDTTNLLRRRDNMPAHQAIIESGKRRLRPILMTALATILGMLPMALGLGEGGELQAPLARAVVGGLFSSTLITLIIIPIVYSYFEEGFKIKSSQ